MNSRREGILIYLAPITAILIAAMAAWWYFGLLKQRVRDKPLAAPTEPWRPKTSPYPTEPVPESTKPPSAPGE